MGIILPVGWGFVKVRVAGRAHIASFWATVGIRPAYELAAGRVMSEQPYASRVVVAE